MRWSELETDHNLFLQNMISFGIYMYSTVRDAKAVVTRESLSLITHSGYCISYKFANCREGRKHCICTALLNVLNIQKGY